MLDSAMNLSPAFFLISLNQWTTHKRLNQWQLLALTQTFDVVLYILKLLAKAFKVCKNNDELNLVHINVWCLKWINGLIEFQQNGSAGSLLSESSLNKSSRSVILKY